MTEGGYAWTARVTVRTHDEKVVDWLEQAMRPEASRDVPRANAEVLRDARRSLSLSIRARDSGAMRAALNTYLGWVHLALATARAADRPK